MVTREEKRIHNTAIRQIILAGIILLLIFNLFFIQYALKDIVKLQQHILQELAVQKEEITSLEDKLPMQDFLHELQLLEEKVIELEDELSTIVGEVQYVQDRMAPYKREDSLVIARAIVKESRLQGVDYKLITELAMAESGFNSRAVSKAGAMGVLQLMPGTARELGVADPFVLSKTLEEV